MILADTSVWIDHLRSGDPQLSALLEAASVLTHPFVIGEIAMGNLRQRTAILSALGALPRAAVATEDEALRFIQDKQLAGLGIGYIDAHLLAATLLTASSTLWTRDQRLKSVAIRLNVASQHD